MGRWSHYDTDEERLPEGMVRIGYDADDQTYTYRNTTDGSIWESAPGNRYGRLRQVSGPSQPSQGGFRDDGDNAVPPPPYEDEDSGHYAGEAHGVSWRTEMMPLLNFFMLIALFMMGVFWYLHWMAGGESGTPVPQCARGSYAYNINPGDTCWAIAEGRGLKVEDVLRLNKGLDCDRLAVGSAICVPES